MLEDHSRSEHQPLEPVYLTLSGAQVEGFLAAFGITLPEGAGKTGVFEQSYEDGNIWVRVATNTDRQVMVTSTFLKDFFSAQDQDTLPQKAAALRYITEQVGQLSDLTNDLYLAGQFLSKQKIESAYPRIETALGKIQQVSTMLEALKPIIPALKENIQVAQQEMTGQDPASDDLQIQEWAAEIKRLEGLNPGLILQELQTGQLSADSEPFAGLTDGFAVKRKIIEQVAQLETAIDQRKAAEYPRFFGSENYLAVYDDLIAKVRKLILDLERGANAFTNNEGIEKLLESGQLSSEVIGQLQQEITALSRVFATLGSALNLE